MARRSREEAAEDSSTVGAAPSSRKCRKAVYGLPESLKDLSLSFRTENSLLCPASTKQVHRLHVCGRVIQASPPNQLGLKIIDALDPRDNRVPGDPLGNVPPRYNGAPSQQLWVIRQNPQTGERSLDLLQWGLLPYWCKDKPKPPPINAKAETVDRLPMFREAYRKRRCIVPIDGFFEWMAIKGAKVKQPYAIAMKDRSPFGLAGLWENWKNPATGGWVRTFCIITTSANELVGRIHDRMPAILRPEDYGRWLALDPDGPNLRQPFPSEPMIIWPISTRVNSPKNDDADLLEPLADADAFWPPEGNSALPCYQGRALLRFSFIGCCEF